MEAEEQKSERSRTIKSTRYMSNRAKNNMEGKPRARREAVRELEERKSEGKESRKKRAR